MRCRSSPRRASPCGTRTWGRATACPTPTSSSPIPGSSTGPSRSITVEGFQTVKWSHVSDISLARPNQTAFTTYQDDQNRTHVVFGDNSSGRIPSVNSQVYCQLPLRRRGHGQQPRPGCAEHDHPAPRREHHRRQRDQRQVAHRWQRPRVHRLDEVHGPAGRCPHPQPCGDPQRTTPTWRCRFPASPSRWPTAPSTPRYGSASLRSAWTRTTLRWTGCARPSISTSPTRSSSAPRCTSSHATSDDLWRVGLHPGHRPRHGDVQPHLRARAGRRCHPQDPLTTTSLTSASG